MSFQPGRVGWGMCCRVLRETVGLRRLLRRCGAYTTCSALKFLCSRNQSLE